MVSGFILSAVYRWALVVSGYIGFDVVSVLFWGWSYQGAEVLVSFSGGSLSMGTCDLSV